MSNFKHLLKHHTPLELQLELTTGKPVEGLYAPIRELHHPYQCPASLLPYLAYHRGVDFWKDNWPENLKRDVINASVAVHRKKGTRLGVRTGIAATGVTAEIIVDKKHPLYVPHTFQIKVDAETHYPNANNIKDIRYQVDHTNATRCNYDLIYKNQLSTTKNAIATTIISKLKQQATQYLKKTITTQVVRGVAASIRTRTKQKNSHYTQHHAKIEASRSMQGVIFTRLREAT